MNFVVRNVIIIAPPQAIISEFVQLLNKDILNSDLGDIIPNILTKANTKY